MTQFACQPFVTVDDVLDAGCGCDLDENDDYDLIEVLIDQASDMLSLMTGGVISGICQVKVRPVALCGGASTNIWYSRYESTEYVSRYGYQDWRRRFGGLNTIPLRGPNTNIVEVVVDGTVLNTSEYGLVDNQYLFRRNKNWPTVNDLTLDDTQDNTFSVTYRFGRTPDKLTKMACVELTCELVKDALGRKSTLPRGVTSASIQGASISIRDRAQALREGDEQIPVLARFLSVYAPDGPDNLSGVWAPELEQLWNLVEVEGPSGS